MAILSNINGLLEVDSTGAILFSDEHGTTGQILRSNGDAAPTWINFNSTGFGGDYLPLDGGTLIGATATASGISFTVGGVLTGTTAIFTRLDINASNTKLKGDLLGNVDAAYDIGASGANRPRNLYLSNSITAGDITTTGVGSFGGNVTAVKILASTTANGIELNQSVTGSATYYVMDNTVETGGKRYRFGYSGGSSDKGSFSIYNETDDLMPLLLSGSGNVGIGVTPTKKLTVNAGSTSGDGINVTGSSSPAIYINETSGTVNSSFQNDGGGSYLGTSTSHPMIFRTAGTARMRITSAGHILLGNTTASLTSDTGFKYIDDANVPYFGEVVNTSTGNGYSSFHHYNTNASFNGFRFYILNNGGIVNYSSNNTNLSDERVKHNIENSGNYLDKICSIPVRLFNYKDEPEGTDKNLGVIAQEVEAIAPELVNNDGFGEIPEDGIPLKTVYSNDMMYALMKAIQELEARIKELENK